MFNKITVEYYGTQTPVNQLASFHMPEPRMIVIQPFDKSSLGAIERAIRKFVGRKADVFKNEGCATRAGTANRR